MGHRGVEVKIPASIEKRIEEWRQSPFKCKECGVINGRVGEHVDSHPKHPDHCSMKCLGLARQREEEEQRLAREKHDEEMARERHARFLESLPPRYREMSSSTWDGTKPTPRGVYERWDGILLIFGGVGAGKTHMAVALAKMWMREHRQQPVFHDALELVWRLRPPADEEGEQRRNRILTELESPALLVLDDIGAERSTEFSSEQLSFTVRERHRWEKPTILTSNFGPKALKKWNAQVASRLHDGSIIKLDGPDRRQAK